MCPRGVVPGRSLPEGSLGSVQAVVGVQRSTPSPLSRVPRAPQYSPQCEPGCVCPDGLVADGGGRCVAPTDCPCVHNEASYLPGQTIRVGCNTWYAVGGLPAVGGGTPASRTDHGVAGTCPTPIAHARLGPDCCPRPPAPARTGSGSAQRSPAWPPAPCTGMATMSPLMGGATALAGTAGTRCCRYTVPGAPRSSCGPAVRLGATQPPAAGQPPTSPQDHCRGNDTTGTFRVVSENVPCGTTGVTCSKAIKLFLGVSGRPGRAGAPLEGRLGSRAGTGLSDHFCTELRAEAE